MAFITSLNAILVFFVQCFAIYQVKFKVGHLLDMDNLTHAHSTILIVQGGASVFVIYRIGQNHVHVCHVVRYMTHTLVSLFHNLDGESSNILNLDFLSQSELITDGSSTESSTCITTSMKS